jgi:hypothetical protein
VRPYIEKIHYTHKKGLVEWFKVKALSSSPSSVKKNVYIYKIELCKSFLMEYFDQKIHSLWFIITLNAFEADALHWI